MKKKVLLMGIALTAITCLGGCSGGKAKEKASSDYDIEVWTNKLKPATTISNVKNSPFHKGLEKKTGIKVKWTFPSDGTDEAQAFNLMTSEDKLPDIIQYPMAKNADSYIDDGLIQDLTKVLPKKAPHYWKFLKAHPEYDRAMKSDSGKYYSFGFFRENVVQATFKGPIIRQDWLKEQGLSEPRTAADLENVLTKFKEAYGAKLAFVPGHMSPGFAGAFGAYGTFSPTYYLDENNKVQLAQLQPEWKEYMTWLSGLYKKGLIDPDVITLDDDGLKTKVLNNKVGVTVVTAGTVTSFMESAEANGKPEEWKGMYNPNQANGQKATYVYDDQMINSYGFQISGSCTGKKLDKALKWLDWAYTDEGQRYWNYGTEGKSYEMKNGVPTFTDEITKNKLGTMEALMTYTGNVDVGTGIQDEDVVNARNNPSAEEAMNKWYDKNDAAFKHSIPRQSSYTVKESKKLASVDETINSYTLENTLKFLTGERPMSDYDKFVKELKKQNVDEAIKIRQDSFDRYQER